MDTAPQTMKTALERLSGSLRDMHGPIMSRHFTLNPTAGTIRDIRDGSLWAYVDEGAIALRFAVRFPIAKA